MAAVATTYARILTNIVDNNDEVTANVLDWMQSAIYELEDLHLFKVNHESVTTATTEDTRLLVARPSDWNGIRKSPYYIDGYGGKHQMSWLEDTEELDLSYSEDPDDKGPPKCILVTDTELKVYPLPDALCSTGDVYSDGDYRVVVPYWKRLADLGFIESNWFTTDHSLTLQFIEQRVTAQCLDYNRDNEEYLKWLTRAESTLRKVKRKQKRDGFPTKLTLTPRRGADASRTTLR